MVLTSQRLARTGSAVDGRRPSPRCHRTLTEDSLARCSRTIRVQATMGYRHGDALASLACVVCHTGPGSRRPCRVGGSLGSRRVPPTKMAGNCESFRIFFGGAGARRTLPTRRDATIGPARRPRGIKPARRMPPRLQETSLCVCLQVFKNVDSRDFRVPG